MKNIVRLIIVTLVYIITVALLGVKSLYSVNEQFVIINLIYFFIHTGGYIYLVYHFYTDKSNKLALLCLMSILIGYIPYDSELTRSIELIYNPSQNLSGLAAKLPVHVGVAVDLFFYPVILFLSFLFLFLVVKKRN